MNITNFTKKITELYGKVPAQFRRHTSEMNCAISQIIHEYEILNNDFIILSQNLTKTIKAFEKLKNEYEILSKDYEKLNKKLNNELIK